MKILSIRRIHLKHFLWFCLLSFCNLSWAILQEPHNNYLKLFHPAFDLIDIQPNGFEAKITGMDFLSDGRMAISTRYQGVNGAPSVGNARGIGDVYILNNVVNGNPSTITIDTIATKLNEPMGLTVVNDNIYIIDRHYIRRYTTSGQMQTVGPEHYQSGDIHPYAFGLAHYNGFLYGSYGVYSGPSSLYTQGYKISLAGQRTTHGTGLRHTNGWGIGPEGIVLTTTNQGNYYPASELIHVREDHFYGYIAQGVQKIEETPPVIYFPQGIAGNSPAQPVLIPSGIYKDQLLVGEIRYPNMHRVFIEKIQGQWQGVLFHFAGGLDCGANRMVWGPDGNLYIGQIGQIQGNIAWSFKDNNNPEDDAAMAPIQEVEYGLKRMVPNGKSVFEMLTIKAFNGGFDVEFTEEVEVGAAAPSKFTLEQWRYEEGNGQYGGVPLDSAELTIDSTLILPGNKIVRLFVSGLLEEHVIHFKVNDLRSATGADSWNKLAWYNLNKYGPDPVTSIDKQKSKLQKIEVKISGGDYYLNIEGNQKWKVTLYDHKGRVERYYPEAVHGEYLFSHGNLNSGIYFLKIKAREIIKSRKISVLK